MRLAHPLRRPSGSPQPAEALISARSGIVWCKDRYPGVRGGFGEPVVIGEQGGEFRAEQPCCGQVDRVQGAQQPVGLDDGGADDVLVDLDILESI